MRITREMFIPKGALKVADKNSDAVAYLYDNGVGPCGMLFYGKQSKPAWKFRFRSIEERVAKVTAGFASRQAYARVKAERAAKAKEMVRKVEPGTFFYTSWGYDQTNIDWYMVVDLVGKASLRVVKVAGMDASTGNEGWAQGKSIPSEKAIGEPFLVRAKGSGFKVGREPAYLWDGTPQSWTAYA